MKSAKLYFLLSLLILAHVTLAQEYKGEVVGISDGDTFTMLTTEKKQIKVRLSEIDTPERAQPFGTRARQALSGLVFNKQGVVLEEDMDRYGRLVGHVYVEELHVNSKMVAEGMAWVYRQYLKDRSLLEVENEARLAKHGLWSLPSTEQVPPWEWRRGNRTAQAGSKTSATPTKSPGDQGQQFNCAGKTRCSEMISCEEAMFYLKECGLNKIDGDKDGVPCENLCH